MYVSAISISLLCVPNVTENKSGLNSAARLLTPAVLAHAQIINKKYCFYYVISIF